MDQLNSYLFISAALFSIGLFGVMTRRNGIAVLMGVELILNAANINFVAFSRFGGMNLDGHIFALIVIVLAAAEAAVAVRHDPHLERAEGEELYGGRDEQVDDPDDLETPEEEDKGLSLGVELQVL